MKWDMFDYKKKHTHTHTDEVMSIRCIPYVRVIDTTQSININTYGDNVR